MSKINVIKLNKTATSKIDLAKKTLSVCLNFWNVNLSDTEMNVLAYFIIYGINNKCKELIVKAVVCKNIPNINTIMVKLKKLGLIYRDELNGKNYLCKALNFEITPTIGFLIKIETK
jgi:hypothetical protein